jgi:pimeloyl-ACP methyl ester carboxylesterase
MFFSRCFFLVIFQILILLGCSAANLQKFSLETPAQILNPVGMPSVKDGRARFREIFCKLLSEAPEYHDKTGNCENYLTQLSDERMPVEQFRQLPDNNVNLRILIVPGLLGECIADTAFPFETAMEHLRPMGYQIEPLLVSGRSSSDYNAKQIAEAVENLALDKENYLILIGHSKGAVDILHFLVNYPELAHRVDAVVSVAGAINGSPFANRVADIYGELGANLPLNECEPGDGGAFRSLERSVRLTWMANNPLPASVKYYSVVSFTDRDRINRWLISGYDMLKTIDPRNDGLLLFSDQVIPGAILLGYLNDDHWEVALPFEDNDSMPSKMISKQANYPREILLHAIILFVTENLNSSEGSD